MDALKIIKRVNNKYFDYQKLSNALNESSHIRREISRLIKNKHIIRVKKGLYIWGNELSNSIYSKEILANLIFGPSYVSLEYALSYHGLTPEKVEVITSVTNKKKKSFETPIGRFSYEHIHQNAYSWGVELIEINKNESFIMASPEKALLDYICLRVRKWENTITINEYNDFLYSNLRIDKDIFKELNLKKMYKLSCYYKNSAVRNFSLYLKNITGE